MVSAMVDMRALERRRRELMRDYEIVLRHAAHSFEHGGGSVWRRCQYFLSRQFLSHYFFEAPAWRVILRHLGGERAQPDFAVIGAAKSGTSELSVSLMLHPNVLSPLAKEFFPLEWSTFHPTQRARRRHAERHGLALVPFVQPTLHWVEGVQLFAQMRPRPRIVIALREPVARMYSHWKWELLMSGRQHAEALPFLGTFAGYVNHALERFPDAPLYTFQVIAGLPGSIYWKSVRYWIEWCGAENVMVIDVGEYFRDRENVMRRIQEFVGLPYVAIPPPPVRVNENPLNLPPMDDESRAKLQAFFRPHNARLWEVIGQRFAW
jgi:hypothetical protein